MQGNDSKESCGKALAVATPNKTEKQQQRSYRIARGLFLLLWFSVVIVLVIDGWDWYQRDLIRQAVAEARIIPGVTRVPDVFALLAPLSPKQSVLPRDKVPPHLIPQTEDTDILVEFPRQTSMALVLRCNAESFVIRDASLWLWSDSKALDVNLFSSSVYCLAFTIAMLVALPFLRRLICASNEFIAYLYAVIPVLATLSLLAIGVIVVTRLFLFSDVRVMPYHDETAISATWPVQAKSKNLKQ